MKITVFLISFITFVCRSEPVVLNIYVSPNGDNNNTGLSSTTPFKTLEYTKDYIRTINKQNYQPVVNLMEGTFYTSSGSFSSLLFEPEDSGYSANNKIIYKSYEENILPVIISGGYSLPSNCFELYDTVNDTNIYKCDVSNYLDNIKPDFRSIRIGTKRGTPSRYPKLSSNDNPYTDGWIFTQVAIHEEGYKNIIGVKCLDLLPSLRHSNVSGKVHLYPYTSWTNMEVPVEGLPNYNPNRPDICYFRVTCPQDDHRYNHYAPFRDGQRIHQCHPGSFNSRISSGNRFYFFTMPIDIIPIEQNNEWYYDYATNILYIGSEENDSSNLHIVIPSNNHIINFQGDYTLNSNHAVLINNNRYAKNIEFNGITFMDNDYAANGYQYEFNIRPQFGIPEDAAIRMGGSKNIVIKNCKFLELASGGITISNKSENILISNNEFFNLGQSGINGVGNTQAQPSKLYIEYNIISHVGTILASAAGIYGSTIADSVISFNKISYSSRWGIHIRTNRAWAASKRNKIYYNTIYKIGLTTHDLGAISLIAEAPSNEERLSEIYYNCIKDAVGLRPNDWKPNFDNSLGLIFTPHDAHGIYLDNFATEYNIYGNIIINSGGQSIQFHNAKLINFENNILYNNEFQFLIHGSTNNKIKTNIIYYNNDHPAYIGKNKLWNDQWFSEIDYNLFYNPNYQLDQIPNFISDYNTARTFNWWNINQENDLNSIINQDPLFTNPENGDFTLNEQSLALTELNFASLPDILIHNCLNDMDTALLECPFGSEKIGVLNDDILGCGLEGCDTRFTYETSEDCLNSCVNNMNCKSFNWSPINGHIVYPDRTVCNLYDTDIPDSKHGPYRILCRPLKCPVGFEQVGQINDGRNDHGINENKYEDSYSTIEECAIGCENNTNCTSFTWSPLNGDRDHISHSVCKLYNSDIVTDKNGKNRIMCKPLQCPDGSEQIGEINDDIAGCGLEGCNNRYQDTYPTKNDCLIGCINNNNCKSFSWAPLNGDKNHHGKSVCTLYNSDVPNRKWAPNQIMCKPSV